MLPDETPGPDSAPVAPGPSPRPRLDRRRVAGPGRPRAFAAAELRRLHAQGLTDGELAEVLRVSDSSIRHHRRALGLRGNPPAHRVQEPDHAHAHAQNPLSKQLKTQARQALDRYLERPCAATCHDAEVAVWEYWRHFGTLRHRGYLWRIDAADELVKERSCRPGVAPAEDVPS